MRNKFLLLATLLLCSLSAFAQIQSEQGKVVLTDGRTIEGKIAYYYDNPLVLNVYDAANNKQTFAPKNIQEITLISGERYVAKPYTSPFETSTMIFQVVVSSDKISLFKREAANLEFYAYRDDVVHKLENNEVTVTEPNGKRYKKFDYKYVGTLTTLMQDRADLIEKIQKTDFTEKGLASVVTAYNNGNVTYYFASGVEVVKKPYWVAYAHFSNHATFLEDETTGPSRGYQVGAQYYFSAKSRNSIRIGLDVSNYEFERTVYKNYTTDNIKWTNKHKSLSFKYQYDFVKQEKIKVYLLAHLLDVGTVQESAEELDYEGEVETSLWLRMSPGAGFEYNATDKISAFAEANNLLRFKQIPKSFSLGVKYSFRK